jgi:hypothetical protein
MLRAQQEEIHHDGYDNDVDRDDVGNGYLPPYHCGVRSARDSVVNQVSPRLIERQFLAVAFSRARTDLAFRVVARQTRKKINLWRETKWAFTMDGCFRECSIS